MTLTQTVEIPENRLLRLDLEIPREIPTGKTDVVIQFPVREEVQQEPATAPCEPSVSLWRGSHSTVEEKPKMHIPKDSNEKFILTKEIIEEMKKNSPHTRVLSGILSDMGDVDLDKARMERLAKHL